MAKTVHIIGAGLAGLTAAVRLVERGVRVAVYEAAPQAGGRCRSYFDASLGMTIDNGNHLVLSGNRATLDYVRAIGAADSLVGPERAEFPFVDLATGERWTLKLSDGRAPWWIFDKRSRVPGTRAHDYLGLARLAFARSGRVSDVIAGKGPVYTRLLRPFLLAALNTEPLEAPAPLAAALLQESVARGGRMCRPLIARAGLSAVLVDPALRKLQESGATIRFGSRLRSVAFEQRRIAALDFGEEVVSLGAADGVILAVPPVVASALLPGLVAPSEHRSIVNAHFKVTPPADMAPMIGVVNATTEWLFAFPDRLSVTVSGADRLLDTPREKLAETIWGEVSKIAKLGSVAIPPWQIVRERRATFAATPDEAARRPPTRTDWDNLALAGDWTDTGLPATIEGAVRSGERAAALIERA